MRINKEALGSEESKYDEYFALNNASAKLKEVLPRITDGDIINLHRQSSINLLLKNKRTTLLIQRQLTPLVGMMTIKNIFVALVAMSLTRKGAL